MPCLPKIHRLEIRQTCHRFRLGIKRQRRIVTGRFCADCESGIFFLQVAGIWQQNAAQINRGRSGINRSAKSILHQSRNPAAMVQVGVRQNHMLRCRWPPPANFASCARAILFVPGTVRNRLILACRFCRRSPGSIDQVLRSGHCTGCPKELNVCQKPSANVSLIRFYTRRHCVSLSGTLPSFRVTSCGSDGI